MGKGRRKRSRGPELTPVQRFLEDDMTDIMVFQGMQDLIEEDARQRFIARRKDLETYPWADRTSFVDFRLLEIRIDPQGQDGVCLVVEMELIYRKWRTWSGGPGPGCQLSLLRQEVRKVPEQAEDDELIGLSLSLTEQVQDTVLEAVRCAPVQQLLPPDPDGKGPPEEELSLDPRLFRHIQGVDRQEGPLRWDLFPELRGREREKAMVFWDGNRHQILLSPAVRGSWDPMGLPFFLLPGVNREVPRQVDLRSTGDLFRFLPALARAWEERGGPELELLWPAGRDMPRVLLWGFELALPLPELPPGETISAPALLDTLLEGLQGAVDALSFLGKLKEGEQSLVYQMAVKQSNTRASAMAVLCICSDLNERGAQACVEALAAPGPWGEPLLLLEGDRVTFNRPFTSSIWPEDPKDTWVTPRSYTLEDVPFLKDPAPLLPQMLADLKDEESRWNALMALQDRWSPSELLAFLTSPPGESFLDSLTGPDREYALLLLDQCRQSSAPPQPEVELL